MGWIRRTLRKKIAIELFSTEARKMLFVDDVDLKRQKKCFLL
jgi:hypothetical protein